MEGRKSYTMEATGEGEASNNWVIRGPWTGQVIFGILIRRQETPGWEEDTVQQQNGLRCLGRRGKSGINPLYGQQTAEGEFEPGSISKLCNNQQQRLGLEWSMSEVGTSPPHDVECGHTSRTGGQ